MTPYINVWFNHFAAVQHWANESAGAQADLDMRDFTLEVKHRGRYYRMFPMFQARVQGQLAHMPRLTQDVRGFGGWRPYQTFTHPHSSDKTLFKSYLQQSGLRVPRAWDFPGEPPTEDYVLKPRSGSFGRGLLGPFRGGKLPAVPPAQDMFAEQFVPGRMLKVWYWGARPFFAHIQDCPAIVGDGRSTAGELLQRKVAAARLQWESFEQKPVALDCLAFQGLALEDRLAQDRSAWIDFRYAQLYEAPVAGSTVSDNQLDALVQGSGDQASRMGEALARLLRQSLPAPVVITVDGVLDAEGRIWWLEMNTNSLLPPDGYAVMFADLFA